MTHSLYLLAKIRQEEILRDARSRRIDLGPFQDEEQELLALDHEHQLRQESLIQDREPVAVG